MTDTQRVTSPFTDLDRMPPEMVTLVIDALDGMAAHPEIRRVREVALAALRPAPGQRLLEAGCGTGDVARRLAALVAPTGEVVALDSSAVTVATARRRHDGSAVRYLVGDVAALDLPDDAFDGVRCERVLQHVAEPERAVAELARVTRPGGRVCLIDTDWESLAVDGPPAPLVGTVREHLFGQVMRQHRDMGRTLRRRLVRAGLVAVTAIPTALYFDDPAAASAVLPMVNHEVGPQVGMIRADLRDRWFTEIDAATRRGDFLATLTLWVVTGTVPAGGATSAGSGQPA
nr:methyltransferase domain-containing protein [Micromonospora sp. DSM 115978]